DQRLLRTGAHEGQVAVTLHHVAQMPLRALSGERPDRLELVEHHRDGSARVAADLAETLEHAVERLAAVLLAGRAAVDAESDGRWPAALVEPDCHARREPTQHVLEPQPQPARLL